MADGSQMRAADLFAGLGGFSEGAAQAGAQIVFALLAEGSA